MDVGTHLRAIWQRRYLVVGGALLLALAVFGLRASVPTTYTSTAVLFVVPGGGEVADVQGEIRRLTAAYADLVDDPAVIAATARAVGASEAAVDRRTQIEEANDGQVAVSATGESATASAELANALSVALSAAADAQQEQALARELAPLDAELADLDRQIQAGDDSLTGRQSAVVQARVQQLSAPRARLDIVNAARPAQAAAAPQPARDALLAFLLALIVQAEAAALFAARRAGLEGRDPGKVLRTWTGLPVFRIGESRRGPDQSAAALLHVRADGPAARSGLVVSLASTSDETTTDLALAQVVEAGAGSQQDATVVDLRSQVDPASANRLPIGTKVVRPSRLQIEEVVRSGVLPEAWHPFAVLVADGWEDPDFLLLTRALHAQPFIVTDTETVRRPELQQTVDTLRDARTPPEGVLVVEQDDRQRQRGGRRRGRGSDDAEPSRGSRSAPAAGAAVPPAAAIPPGRRGGDPADAPTGGAR